jgi:hypothetical protein
MLGAFCHYVVLPSCELIHYCGLLLFVLRPTTRLTIRTTWLDYTGSIEDIKYERKRELEIQQKRRRYTYTIMAKSSARRRATSNNSNSTANCCSNNSGGRRNKRMAKALPLLLLSQLSTSGVDAVPSSLRRRRAAESHHRRAGEKSESPPFYPAHSQPQHHRTLQTTVHNYCGIDWTTANSQCGTPCPSGESTFCPAGETCFGDLAECPGLIVEDMVAPPQPASLTGGAVGGDGNNGVAADAAAAVGGGGGGSSSYVPPSIPSHCTTTPNVNTVNIGYYQSWARYRPATCHPLLPKQIPYAQFGYTHLIYSFAGIAKNGVIESYNGVLEEYGFYQEFNSLKQQGNTNGPALKTLIAIGGWNFDQTLFTNVASTPEKRTTFANSVVDFLVTHGFDGLGEYMILWSQSLLIDVCSCSILTLIFFHHLHLYCRPRLGIPRITPRLHSRLRKLRPPRPSHSHRIQILSLHNYGGRVSPHHGYTEQP